MEDIIIKNGLITNHVRQFKGDILISGGKIAGIAKKIEVTGSSANVIDASGLLVIPGGVDPHVHMELPSAGAESSDSFESGSIAALSGGTTTIIDFVTPGRGESLISALKKRKKAAEGSQCDYALHMSVTSVRKNTENEINYLVKNEGITSFKLYMAYKSSIGMDDHEILKAMDMIKNAGGFAMIHCENGDAVDFLMEKFENSGNTKIRNYPLSRPPEIEEDAVDRAIFFSQLTGCPLYIVHMTTERSVEKVINAKKMGLPVYAETCPHYLILDDSVYNNGLDSGKYVMSPPLRKFSDKERLWAGIREGAIEVVSTDHCPFNFKGENAIESDDFRLIPKGIGSVDHRLSLLYTKGVAEKRININQFVNLTSTRPAKIFGLYPRKGALMKGSDADIVLWNPNRTAVITKESQFENCDTSVYDGYKIKGGAEVVISGGNIVFNNGLFDLKSAKGKYLFRKK